MDENITLDSWKNSDDPGSGDFKFRQDGEGGYVIKNKAVTYWKSRIKGTFMRSDKIPSRIFYLLSNFSTNSSSYFKKPLLSENDNYARLVINFFGEFKVSGLG